MYVLKLNLYSAMVLGIALEFFYFLLWWGYQRVPGFSKATGKGQGQEAGRTFQKSVFGRKPISLATV